VLRDQTVENRPRLTGIKVNSISDAIDQTPVARGWASDGEENATLILVEMLPHEPRGNRIAHRAFEFLTRFSGIGGKRFGAPPSRQFAQGTEWFIDENYA
jgi:hypothetical protein